MFGGSATRPAWASAELPDARVYGGSPVEATRLTAEVSDAFRREFSLGVEAVLAAKNAEATRRAVARMKELGVAWNSLTATWLPPGLEEVLGYEQSRRARKALDVPGLAWSPTFLTALPDREAFALFERHRAGWARDALKAVARPFEALHVLATGHRINFYRPRVQRASVAGVSLGIAPMPDDLARVALAHVGEALRFLGEQRRVPWLRARLPPVTITNQCIVRDGGVPQRFNGSYTPHLRVVEVCASWAAEAPVRELAMTIAHESGHHVWRTVLSGAAQKEWAEVIERPVAVRTKDIVALWRPGEAAETFVERVSESDPVMALRLGGALSYGTLAGMEREHLVAMGPTSIVLLSATPVTVYGAKNPEEAFCEALGLLAAYGPRTVLPEVAAALQTIVPTVRPKSNDMVEHIALHTGIETVMEAEERDEHEAHLRHLHQRGRRKSNAATAGYEPDPAAPTDGEWDRSGNEPRWRQSHESLVRDALRSWKGDPITMRLHFADEREHEPEPGSGTGKTLRAQARALLWELAHHARPSPIALHRGSHVEPNGIQSWSEKRRVASSWASRNGGRVFTLPKGTRGLRVLDYTSSAFDSEAEWVVDVDTLTKTNGHQRRRKSNSARAERRREREVGGRYETVVTPAALSRGHFREAEVQRDTRIAERVREHSFHYTSGSGERVHGRSELLGSGNFGIGYRVDAEGGERVVKIPAAHDVQHRAWSRKAQTANLRHEAGVANELVKLGYTIIPRTTYVEFEGGTPALVRDYGLPPGPLSVEEYAELERQLLAIERRHGWGVHDDLAIYRRPDGSIFVGDVGFWTAPRPRVKGKSRVWSAFNSDLDHLLARVREQHGVPHTAGLYRLLRDAKRVLGLRAEVREFGSITSFDQRLVNDFLAAVRAREALGLVTPAEVAPAVAVATKIAAR